MKRKLFCIVLFSGILFFLSNITASAHNGSWQSYDQIDYNGVSQVGTSVNKTASNGGYFQLAVYARRGGAVGYTNYNLLSGQSAYRSYWGQPGLVRYGVVAAMSYSSHNPWFAA